MNKSEILEKCKKYKESNDYLYYLIHNEEFDTYAVIYTACNYFYANDEDQFFGTCIYVSENNISDEMADAFTCRKTLFNIPMVKIASMEENSRQISLDNRHIRALPLKHRVDSVPRFETPFYPAYSCFECDEVIDIIEPKAALQEMIGRNDDFRAFVSELTERFGISGAQLGIVGSAALGAEVFADYDIVFYGDAEELRRINGIIADINRAQGVPKIDGFPLPFRMLFNGRTVDTLFVYDPPLLDGIHAARLVESDVRFRCRVTDDTAGLQVCPYFKVDGEGYSALFIAESFFHAVIKNGDIVEGRGDILEWEQDGQTERVLFCRDPFAQMIDYTRYFFRDEKAEESDRAVRIIVEDGHKTRKIQNVEGHFMLRNEQNGMTVHVRSEHLFYFYEGAFIEDLAGKDGQVKEEDLLRFMAGNKERVTKNVQSDNPVTICWMVSGSCNLDCIYCFAKNKMFEKREDSADVLDTARHLLGLKPVCINLTGGEPTLNPKLKDILLLFNGKVSTILDTNGTTPQLTDLIPVLKKTNTTVRLTVDILDDEILNIVRPQLGGAALTQTEILKRNIRGLTEAGVPVVVHTVLTKYNLGKLEATAEELLRLGVKRWHFYPVNYSEKCRDFFDSIKVSLSQACEYTDTLAECFGKEIKITCPHNDIGFRERTVLLVDSAGRFCVDTIYNGCLFLGENPHFPTKEEILAGLNFELHKQAYLCNYWDS